MITKHKTTQPERAFWRDAFLAAEVSTLVRHKTISAADLATLSADFADAAIEEYRTRILWAGRK
jgi:hypothetical protein